MHWEFGRNGGAIQGAQQGAQVPRLYGIDTNTLTLHLSKKEGWQRIPSQLSLRTTLFVGFNDTCVKNAITNYRFIGRQGVC